jgi:hypothetical protein
MTPTLPTIHLNGTSRKDLQESYDAVDDALHKLMDAWGRVEFNSRDYYVQGPEAFPKAQDERWAMANRIRELKEYVDAHREHLYSA